MRLLLLAAVLAGCSLVDTSDLDRESVVGGATYQQTVLADKPLVYLRLGERTPGDVQNLGSDPLKGQPLRTTPGVPGALVGDPDTAYRFSNAHIEYLATAVRFLETRPMSVELWVRPTMLAGPTMLLSTIGEDGMGDNGWALAMHPTTDNTAIKFFQFHRRNGGDDLLPLSPTAPIPGNRWVHVAVTYDGTTMVGYIDGASMGTRPAVRSIGGASVTLFIGAIGYTGDLDEVAIYNTALSNDRVYQHYARGKKL